MVPRGPEEDYAPMVPRGPEKDRSRQHRQGQVSSKGVWCDAINSAHSLGCRLVPMRTRGPSNREGTLLHNTKQACEWTFEVVPMGLIGPCITEVLWDRWDRAACGMSVECWPMVWRGPVVVKAAVTRYGLVGPRMAYWMWADDTERASTLYQRGRIDKQMYYPTLDNLQLQSI